jgi:5'-3' exonuclease
MGIEDFSGFLDRFAKDVYYKIPLTYFAGRRVAIDMANLAYIMTITATKQVIGQTNLMESEPDQMMIDRLSLNKILERLTTFMYYNVEVICCFDSAPNPLKERIKEKRKNEHDKKMNEYLLARQALFGTDPLLRKPLVERYSKARQNIARPNREFMDFVRNTLSALGFVTMKAGDYLGPITGDAEGLAAALCVGGNDICVAAVTTDSDFHVYGGNLAITAIESEQINTTDEFGQPMKSHMHFATVRSMEAMLLQLGMSFATFRDTCIMLGTDYNIRIPMVGPVKVMTLIRKYGSILEVAREKDITPYNYQQVLPIFSASLIKLTLTQTDFDINRFRDHGQMILEAEGLPWYHKIIKELPMISGKLNVTVQTSVPSGETRTIGDVQGLEL